MKIFDLFSVSREERMTTKKACIALMHNSEFPGPKNAG